MFANASFRRELKRIYLQLRGRALEGVFGHRARGQKPPFLLPPREILVLSQRRLGDAVLSLPLFAALREAFPASRVTVLANPYLRGLYEICPDIDRILESAQGPASVPVIRSVSAIRKQDYDLLIDLNTDGSLVFALIALFSGAWHTIGYGQDGRGVFFDTALPLPPPGLHLTDVLLNTLSPLGIRSRTRVFHLSLKGEDCRANRARPGPPGPVVGIHPGGMHPTQRWPLEHFAELADRLIESGTARVLICGGRGDFRLIREIQRRMREEPEPVPEFSTLKCFAAFLSQLDLLVCNNSGPLHLACAVGTRTVSFMGPTRAGRWWPVGEGHRVLRRDDLPCIGCNSGICRTGTFDCMSGIRPEEVFRTVAEMIQSVTPDESVEVPGV